MTADIIVTIVIIAFAIYGLKSGFVRMASGILCLAVSVVAAKFIYPYVSSFIADSSVGDVIYSRVSENTASVIGSQPPDFIQKAGDYTTNGIFDICVDAVTIAAIIVIIFIITRILAASLNLFAKLPVISFFNGVAGLAAGLAVGFAISYLFVTIITVTDIGGSAAWMDNSAIACVLYEKNFILDFIF